MSQSWPGVEYKGYAFTDQELEQVIQALGDNVLNIKKQYWQDKLLNVRDYISKALDAVFKDSNAWREIMGNRAVPAFQNFVNPAYPRAALINLKYRTKLLGAFDKWKQNKDNAFREGGVFETSVRNAKDYYIAGVKIVYRLTGVRPLGLGPATKVFLIASGITPPLDSNHDTLTGVPRNLFFSDTLYFVGYSAIPAIVEAVVYANYAHLAGDASLRDQILSDISQDVEELFKRLAADDVDIVSFRIAYDENKENYYVYLKAQPKSTGG